MHRIPVFSVADTIQINFNIFFSFFFSFFYLICRIFILLYAFIGKVTSVLERLNNITLGNRRKYFTTAVGRLWLFINIHYHTEDEDSAFVGAFWLHSDLPTSHLDDLLCDSQAQSYSFAIYLGCLLQFSESSEQLGEIFAGNSHSSVCNVHYQGAMTVVIRRAHFDRALLSEF